MPELREGLRVDAHEVALPDGRAGLAQPERARPLREAERAHAHRDGAARHHDDLAARAPQPRHALDDVREALERELDAVVRDDVRAQLDDDALGIGEVAARLGHGRSIYRRERPESTRRRPRLQEAEAP